jgi:hypothetical protein
MHKIPEVKTGFERDPPITLDTLFKEKLAIGGYTPQPFQYNIRVAPLEASPSVAQSPVGFVPDRSSLGAVPRWEPAFRIGVQSRG